MGDIINLRQVRKARKRAEDESRAEANRLKHGRTKADKHAAAMAKQRNDALVDGARRERQVHPIRVSDVTGDEPCSAHDRDPRE